MLLGLLALSASATQTLPEPLTFAAALATAENETHHSLVAIEQRIEALRAELGINQAGYGFSVDLEGRLRRIEPSPAAPSDETGDNAASLILSKPIYDFGLQGSRERALGLQVEALELQRQMKIQQRRIEIMEKYFAVLNADNEFITENEALAIGFIRYDNALQDQELGLLPEIEVLRLQSAYEVIRQQRALAQQRQRLTRALLAEAMGYPQQIPSELELPSIELERGLPEDFDALVKQAMAHSLEARVAQANSLAAQAAISIADSEDNPSLEFEFEVSSYERDSRLRDDWRASLYLEVPLYSGGISTDRVKLATAHHRHAVAEQQQLQSSLRLEVLRLWQEIQHQQLTIQGRRVEQNYRDRYLDRSRAEYELEFKTDLGDSMVLFSRSNTERMRTVYALELAYQRLLRLVGADFLEQAALPQ